MIDRCFLRVVLKVWHKCSKPISRYSTALNIAVFPVKWQYERGILFTNTVMFQNVTPTSSHYLQTDVWSSGCNVAVSQRVSRVQSGFSHIKPSVSSLKWNKVMYSVHESTQTNANVSAWNLKHRVFDNFMRATPPSLLSMSACGRSVCVFQWLTSMGTSIEQCGRFDKANI